MADSVLVTVTVIDTVHRVIADSVTIEALKNSQEFYNSAFSCFATTVSVLAVFLAAFTVIAVAFNLKSVNKAEKRLGKIEKEFEKFKEQYENKRKGLFNFIEDSTQRQKEENKKLPLEIAPELQQAINTEISDEQKRKTFTDDYVREMKNFREYDPDTLAILYKFQKEKSISNFIKYLEGFFEALSHWSGEKFNSWTLLSKKQKEAEFVECMRHVDNGKLEEFQLKCARLQSIIEEIIFFLDPKNLIR